MLRFQTKPSGSYKINEGKTGEVEQLLYNNRIKEPIAHLPRGGYISLISAYTPLRPFYNLGQIRVSQVAGNASISTKQSLLFFDNESVNNIIELIPRLNNKDVSITFDAETGFAVSATSTLPYSPPKFELALSHSAAFWLGFKNTVYTFAENEVVRSENFPPPITAASLQILCHNICGNADSNMTFPETIGIMHLVNNLSIVNPHIAVNHRIERGRVIDIEILDQNNRPFRWAPVYLEFFVSDGAEHEKRQGFFRIEPHQPIVFNEGLRRLSVVDIYAPSFLTKFFNKNSMVVKIYGTRAGRPYMRREILEPMTSYDNTVLTRASVAALIMDLNQKIQEKTNQLDTYIRARFHKGVLELQTEFKQIVLEKSFFNLLALNVAENEEIVVRSNSITRLTLNPSMFYNEDEMIEIYCSEFHTRTPLAVGRRIDNAFRLINRNFWAWSELEKTTNVLTFFYRVITHFNDGEEIVSNRLPPSSDLIIKLFYK